MHTVTDDEYDDYQELRELAASDGLTMISEAKRTDIATRKGLIPNAGGEVAAHKTARARRNFYLHIVPFMSDRELLSESDFQAGWIRMIIQGVPTVYRLDEMRARLRAMHREANQRGLTIPWDRTTGMRRPRP